MLAAIEKKFTRTVVGLVRFSARRAAWLLCGASLITLALLYYTATHLSINTNTLDMLDPKLPFRQAERELTRAFPQLQDDIIVVVEADTEVAASDLGSALAARLRQDSQHFASVYDPAGGAFFAHNGLLYLDVPKLQKLADSLAMAQPMLGALTEEMSPQGLFSILGRCFDEPLGADEQAILATIADKISRAIENQLAGKPARVSWKSELFKEASAADLGKRSFILVEPRFDYGQLQPAHEPIAAIRQLIGKTSLDASHGERIRLTGSVVMDDEELASVSQGAKLSSLLSFGLVCLLTVFGLRSLRHVIAILGTLVMGLIWTGAFATAAIGSLNLISVNFAVLFIGMGVDFGIQAGLRYKEEFAADGNHAAAIARMGAGLGGALTLAALAAAASFLAFVPTSYLGLAELGIIAGFGMGVALLANLTLLPAFLSVLPHGLEFKRAGAVGERSRLQHVFAARRPRRALLLAAGCILAGASALLPWVRFDFNPLNMKDPTTESVATFMDLLADPNATPYTISVLAPDLPAAESLAGRLEQLDVVDKTITLASFVPEEQEQKLAIIDDINLALGFLQQSVAAPQPPRVEDQIAAVQAFRKKLQEADKSQLTKPLADSVERLAQALDRLELSPDWPDRAVQTLRDNVVGDLPQTLDRLRQLLSPNAVHLGNLPRELKERYISRDGKARVEIYPREDLRDNQAMRRFVRAVQAIAPTATDTAVELVEGGDAVVHSALQATALAMLATLLLLAAVFRRWQDIVLAILPLVFALILTGASSVALNRPFDLANIIALPLLLGLANAYGIYLVMRVRGGVAVTDLALTNTPRAILYSALAAMISFGTLAFSSHRGMSGMGVLVTLSLSFAVLSTLLVLPALMAEMEAGRKAARTKRG